MVPGTRCSTPGVSASDFTEEGVPSIVVAEMLFIVFFSLLANDQILTCCVSATSIEGFEGWLIFPVDLFLDLDHDNFFFFHDCLWLSRSMQIFVISIR